jgi:two-component system, NtrC family, response regulator HydG
MEGYRAKILIVDDEESNLLAMEKILCQEAYRVATAKQAASALTLFRRQAYDLVLTDLRMPGVSGLELLRAIRKESSSVPVVVLTAYGTVADAVEAMKLGAVDFVAKPLRREALLRCVQDALSRRISDVDSRRNQFIGTSPAISQVKKTIRMLARTNASVLIEGESGTGKEVVAKTIHQESGRSGRLISVNCGAIPESLLESELFGYEKGAFTGAICAKPGLFESADRGTLFLDEIGDMPLSLQVKLLRVLQDGTFFRLGSTEAKRADVRIVAATNSELKRRILEGRFREDLYYRLNVVSLQLPALRDRTEDIGPLADYFLGLAKEAYGRPEVSLSEGAIAAMKAYAWPGNIRELRNLIERTLVMLDGTQIGAAELGLLGAVPKAVVEAAEPELRFVLGTSLRDMEMEAIRRTLEFTGGDKARAAEILGINQRTIYRKLAEM